MIDGQVDVGYTYFTGGLYNAYLEISDGQFTTFSQPLEILVGPNRTPVINLVEAQPKFGDPPLLVTFTADVMDPDNDPLTYHIDFGDGTSWVRWLFPATVRSVKPTRISTLAPLTPCSPSRTAR